MPCDVVAETAEKRYYITLRAPRLMYLSEWVRSVRDVYGIRVPIGCARIWLGLRKDPLPSRLMPHEDRLRLVVRDADTWLVNQVHAGRAEVVAHLREDRSGALAALSARSLSRAEESGGRPQQPDCEAS